MNAEPNCRHCADTGMATLGSTNSLFCSWCNKCELPSAEEIAADEAEMKARMECTGKARKAIVEHLGGPWKKGVSGSAGKITCPICRVADALRFTRSSYNGHIHAACATGCVAWME